MAVVVVSKGVVQGSARWALEFLMREIRPFTPRDSRLAEAIDAAEAEDMGVLDLADLALSDMRVVADVLRQYQAFLQRGESAYASPDSFPAYCKLIDELVAQVYARVAELEASAGA